MSRRRYVDGQRVNDRNGFLDAPPMALRGALSAVRVEHVMKESKTEGYLKVFERNKLMQKEYGYPGSDKDLVRKALQSQASTGDNIAEELDRCGHSPSGHDRTNASGDGLAKSTRECNHIINGGKRRTMSNRGMLQLRPATAVAKELLVFVEPAEAKTSDGIGETTIDGQSR